jgi:three-Cys-motif partner protein
LGQRKARAPSQVHRHFPRRSQKIRSGHWRRSEIHIADAAEESRRAAEKRLVAKGCLPLTEIGRAEAVAARIIKKLNPYGLHFAFLDPYNLQDLPFTVIQAFEQLKRIDMLIHVSAQDLQRNLHSYTSLGDHRLESFAPGWREAVDLNQSQRAIRAAILTHWASKIEALGLPPARHAELVSGPTKNQRLYWLVFASSSDFAKQLWDKIRNLSGQGDLPL